MGAVRIGQVKGEFVVNPTYTERRESTLNITIVGTRDGIVMVESGSSQVSEETVADAIDFAHVEIKKIVAAIDELVSLAGKPKRAVKPVEHDEAYFNELSAKISDRLKDALDTKTHPKAESHAMVKAIKDELAKELSVIETEGQGDAKKKLAKYYELLREQIFREQVTKERIRPDRRAFDEIRQITIETGVLPRVHGSALFTRGETQALVSVTLGTTDDSQRIETFEGEKKKRFMLHYNFPPFSVGEVGRMTGVGRREIGHGALAERAIAAVMPSEEESQYTVRIVSDILESNGSSSMASVCGASLALWDAGFPLKEAVAGVAMGLVKEGDSYSILTDIAGAEDHYGDMDFKVAGTRTGITALQMDIKISGITGQIMREALEQARRGRLWLLDQMEQALTAPREEKSKFAPQIRTLMIPTDKIRDLIGPGGKIIRGIIEQTGVKIDVDDTGRVNVASSDEAGLAKALEIIGNITAVPEVGKTYLGKVVRLAEFGAFIELFPGTDGLLHISEIAEHRVKEVKDELNEGDQVMVKVLGIEGNRIKLSRKALLKEQRVKLGLPEPGAGAGAASDDEGSDFTPSPRPSSNFQPRQPLQAPIDRQPVSNASTITIEGGDDFEDEDASFEEGDEPNFNRVDATPGGAPGAPVAGGRGSGSPGGSGGSGGSNDPRRRRRRGRGRGPGGPGGSGGQGGGRGPK